jgi:nucleotidyltransferase substrate binding protein (TIGR01987 family)
MDLAWKTVKVFLAEQEGIICVSPKDCFRRAYQQKLIEYDDFWIKLVDMRNQTTHTYEEQAAEELFTVLPQALKCFRQLSKVFCP